MGEWNDSSKKMNFGRIYDRIAKYRNTIPELAQEYGMEEEEFIKRIEMGLEPKLFSKAIKISKKIEKQRQKNEEGVEKHREEARMARAKQKEKNREVSEPKKIMEEKSLDEDPVKNLEQQKDKIISQIAEMEIQLDESSQILEVCEKTLEETQKIYEEVKKALEEAEEDLNRKKEDISACKNSLNELKSSLEEVETQIKESKKVYLVAPGYTGEKPEYGKFISTVEVPGFNNLIVRGISEEYILDKTIEDMMKAGYDSIREYDEGLQFTVLCLEYYLNEMEYSVLTNDERIEKLIEIHVN